MTLLYHIAIFSGICMFNLEGLLIPNVVPIGKSSCMPSNTNTNSGSPVRINLCQLITHLESATMDAAASARGINKIYADRIENRDILISMDLALQHYRHNISITSLKNGNVTDVLLTEYKLLTNITTHWENMTDNINDKDQENITKTRTELYDILCNLRTGINQFVYGTTDNHVIGAIKKGVITTEKDGNTIQRFERYYLITKDTVEHLESFSGIYRILSTKHSC